METQGKSVWGRIALVMAGYSVLTLLLAWQAGAFDGSWGSDADEAAHFLNGVMVLDYVRAGFPGNPLGYAENYYQHYPKVGLGHWPPLFAIVEAMWFALAPLSYEAGLVLVNLLAAVVAVQVWWMGRRWFPEWLAVAAGAVWLLLPIVRQYCVVFMAEMMLVVTATAAVKGFARQSMAFGWWSALALLTKGTGVALAALPPVAMVFGGYWGWWRSRVLWGSAVLVLGLTAGWYALAPGARHERVATYGGVMFSPRRFPSTLEMFWETLGPALAVLAMVGVGAAWRKRREDMLVLSCLAFLPGHFVFRMVIGAWEDRHLMMVLPELLLLAGWGFQRVQKRLPTSRMRHVVAVAVVAITAWHLLDRWPRRISTDGFDEAAIRLAGVRQILVAGTIPAEGALICSVALGDARRPGRTVERGTKVLMQSDFMGWSKRLLVHTPEEAGDVLRQRRIEGVVLDRKGEEAYVGMVRAFLNGQGAGEGWKQVAVYQERAEVWVREGRAVHCQPGNRDTEWRIRCRADHVGNKQVRHSSHGRS